MEKLFQIYNKIEELDNPNHKSTIHNIKLFYGKLREKSKADEAIISQDSGVSLFLQRKKCALTIPFSSFDDKYIPNREKDILKLLTKIFGKKPDCIKDNTCLVFQWKFEAK